MSSPAAKEKHKSASLGWHRRLPRALPVGLYRRSVTIFLAALVLFVIAMPLAQYVTDPGLLEALLLTAVLICGVLAVGARRKTLLLGALLLIPALITRWVHHYRPDLVAPGIFLILGVLILILVTGTLLKFVLQAPRVDSEVLAAGVATYLLLGILWAMAYLLVASLVPDAFTLPADSESKKSIDPFSALYFSFVTLSTVGYGDIVPAARVTRMLAVLEAITGVLYLSVLVARLVTLYTDKTE
jgi:ion channel